MALLKQDNLENILKKAHTRLRNDNNFFEQNDIDKCFITEDGLKKVWTYKFLQEFFDGVKESVNIQDLEFIRANVNSLRLLSIMVDIEWLPQNLLIKVRQANEEYFPLKDGHGIEGLRGANEKNFKRVQHDYIPIKIRAKDGYEQPDQWRKPYKLPFIRNESIGKDGSGELYRSRIARGYLIDEKGNVNSVSTAL